MIAMAEKHNRIVEQAEFEIDFEQEFPPWDSFPLYWLAQRWHCTVQHLFNLIESGEIKVALDLRNRASSRAMIRIPRPSLVEFLNQRKDLSAVAEGNPRPKHREFNNEKADKAVKSRASASKALKRDNESAAKKKPFCTTVPCDCTSSAESPSHRKRRPKT